MQTTKLRKMYDPIYILIALLISNGQTTDYRHSDHQPVLMYIHQNLLNSSTNEETDISDISSLILPQYIISIILVCPHKHDVSMPSQSKQARPTTGAATAATAVLRSVQHQRSTDTVITPTLHLPFDLIHQSIALCLQ